MKNLRVSDADGDFFIMKNVSGIFIENDNMVVLFSDNLSRTKTKIFPCDEIVNMEFV